MKKRTLFRKVVSLICCIAICLTTFVPCIYAVGEDPSATMSVSGEAQVYDSYETLITESGAAKDEYKYTVGEDNSITFSAIDGETLVSKTIEFYVKSSVKPVITSSKATVCKPVVADTPVAGIELWLVTVEFTKRASGNYTLSCQVPKTQYTVSFPSSSDYTLEANGQPVTGEKVSYEEGTEVNVTLTSFDGSKDFEVYVGTDKKDLSADGTFKFTVSKNVSITVRPVEKTFKASLTSESGNEGFTYTGASSVAYNGTYTFYVTPEEGWGNPIVTATVGGEPVKPAKIGENQYIINEVKGDVAITVKAGAEIKYNVNVFAEAGVKLTSAENKTVSNNGEYTLSFTVNSAYSKSTPVVTVNGTRVNVTPDENGTYSYQITGIKENKTVEISGLEKNTYKVTTSVGVGYTIVSNNNNTTVNHGDVYTFAVKLDAGYKNAAVTKTVGTSSETITSEDGSYSFVVTADTTITVSVTEQKCSVTTTVNAEGTATVDCTSGNDNGIDFNGTYSFRVTPETGYRVAEVLVNGSAMTGTGNVYTVSNVTKNLVINVTTVENTLTINYVSNDEYHSVPAKASVKYTEIADTHCKALEDCAIHKFAGWFDAEGNKYETVGALKGLVETNDASVTLTAKFELDEQSVRKEVLKLAQTTKNVAGSEGNFTVIFRTDINEVNKDDPCVVNLVKVTAHGTMLARGESVDFRQASDMLANRDGAPTEYKFNQQVLSLFGNEVYNSYYQVNYSWSTFLSFMTGNRLCLVQVNTGLQNKENDRNAAGWLELTIGDQSFIFIADASGITVTN